MAVLPLENLSGDASQEYFADGMTDQLIATLGQISALRVISRTSVMGYKGARKPLPQIARELNVDAVIEGSIMRSGGRVRITAQLIEAAVDKHLWAQSYDGDLRDTLALQSRVARAIAEEIRVNVQPKEQAALKNVKAVNPDAYEAYLKGRYFWNKRTADGLNKAKEYFDEAVAKAPDYAQAYSGLADTYALLGDWQYGVMAAREALPAAKAAAIKALELDNTLGEAHTSLGFVLEWLRLGLGIRRDGISASHRPQSGVRNRSPLVCVALELDGSAWRGDRRNEKGEKPGSALADHQRRFGRDPADCALLRRIGATEPHDDRNGS